MTRSPMASAARRLGRLLGNAMRPLLAVAVVVGLAAPGARVALAHGSLRVVRAARPPTTARARCYDYRETPSRGPSMQSSSRALRAWCAVQLAVAACLSASAAAAVPDKVVHVAFSIAATRFDPAFA